MNAVLADVIYEDRAQQVTWRGVSIADGDVFESFIGDSVASRLHDKEGKGLFESHLRSLAKTDFAQGNLKQILSATIPEERKWAIGEAFAEAYLESWHNITWPWNMERDKRSPNASLPGADLIGFEVLQGEHVRLVLGEVKTSSEANAPPRVMQGRGGMIHQIDNIANNPGLICEILKWLFFRCRNTENKHLFDGAITLYFESGNKAVTLFGILIRDTSPDQKDLENRGAALAKVLQHPTICQLIAICLPCTISDLVDRVTRCEL